MAAMLVPYHSAMQLGSGFNSFNQQLCIDHAVVRDEETYSKLQIQDDAKVEKEVAQHVTYKLSIVDKTTDVTNEMKISPAFNIKNDSLSVSGSGDFINTNKIKDSDFSIMVSVKVINQTVFDHSLVKFQPISGMKDQSAQRLTETYGDSFISGWQEGGEFLAVISIKAKNREDAQTIKVDASVAFSAAKENPKPEGEAADEKAKDSAKGKSGWSGDVTGKFDKLKKSISGENETTISVFYTGGGQRLKAAEQDWDFETMRDVALKFPDLVAKTPMRTHALLTKYTALRDFHSKLSFDVPLYDRTGPYSNVLQEAYLDYKSILSAIQVLAFEVGEGTKALVVNPRAVKAIQQSKAAPKVASQSSESKDAVDAPNADAASENGSIVDIPKDTIAKKDNKLEQALARAPLVINEPFSPDIDGLEEARLKCRFMMSRIISEIDILTVKPEIATDESRVPPYMSPFMFKMLLPLGIAIPPEADAAAQAAAAAQINPDALGASLAA